MYRRWWKKLSKGQQLKFAFASYNAGYNRVERAFRQARESDQQAEAWEQVAPFTPPETRNYVLRIQALMKGAK